jgi:hypothetical protein
MDNGLKENFQLVWNGEGLPDVRYYTTESALITGRPYRFKVQAINTVGLGEMSEVTTIYACDRPGPVKAP